MTVLADHASPYMSHSSPKRRAVFWNDAGLHVLIGDAKGIAHVEALIKHAAPRDYVNLGDVSLDEAAQQLKQLAPQHLLAIGAEPFLQKIDALAWELGQAGLQTQRIGEDLRDVLCMNCRAILKNLRFRIHHCDCGYPLLVRDHYSARRGLYQGAPLALNDPLIKSLSDQKLSL